jgi:hypothetical protein
VAYGFTVDVRQVGAGEFSIRITETDCGPADEATVDVLLAADGPGPPLVGKVFRQTCVLQAGTGTTINPVLREVPVADPDAATRVVVENDPNNQPIPDIVDTEGVAVYDDATPSPLGPWGRLFHQSRPDVGADNVVVTIYRISPRW